MKSSSTLYVIGTILTLALCIGGLYFGITALVDSFSGKLSNWSIFQLLWSFGLFILGIILGLVFAASARKEEKYGN